MEPMDGEPAVRAGLVEAVLGGLLEADGPRLERGAGAVLLAPSVTLARGRGVAADLTDDAESGEATEARAGGGLAVVDTGGVAALEGPGAVVAVLAPGKRDALRAGADGVADEPVGALVGGGGIDALLDGAEDVLATLRMGAEGVGLDVVPVVAVAFVTAAAGAAFTAPDPNVPELIIWNVKYQPFN